MDADQLFLPAFAPRVQGVGSIEQLLQDLRQFREFGKTTQELRMPSPLGSGGASTLPVLVNEFWTSRQRQAHSLHEISYRACFKPQLPRFFMERLTRPGDPVYDPFMGRGTTLIEAALHGRIPLGCDINPLSVVLVRPRLDPPSLREIGARLADMDLGQPEEFPEDLLVFYHPATLREISALKRYFLARETHGELDAVDDWIRMVSINRLTGHSTGFFSVYSLPPNQAVSPRSQRKINAARNQTPPRRDVREIILRKSRSLLQDCDARTSDLLHRIAPSARLLTGAADATRALPDHSVRLVVTSPPFLDVVDYAGDNWLRCWFLGLDAESVPITSLKKLEGWQGAMAGVFRELYRLVQPEGWVAFEVGEVRKGLVKLEESVVPCGCAAGFEPVLVLINDQQFTKTANCWGVSNMARGTNSNRVVIFRKPR